MYHHRRVAIDLVQQWQQQQRNIRHRRKTIEICPTTTIIDDPVTIDDIEKETKLNNHIEITHQLPSDPAEVSDTDLDIFNSTNQNRFNSTIQTVGEYNNGVASRLLTNKYGVPGSTIRNHKSNPNLKVGGGRPTLLTNENEKYLVELLKNLENIGFRLTKSIVLQLSCEYVQRVTGKDIEVGRKWLKNFLQRWQHELKVLKEEKIELARRNGFTESVRRGWFDKLNTILENNDLKTRPQAIFNCDESGFSDETARELVIVSHGTKHAYEESGGSGRSFTTNLVCGSAGGNILPPFIIYSAKQLNPDWTFGGPPGSCYAVSESGWITKK